MADPAPVVYILHGDDEYGIARFVSDLEARLGDPTSAMMDIISLDGSSTSLEELRSAVSAVPFLARRRLVMLSNPLAKVVDPAARERFISLLGQIPQSTALLLVENRPLLSERDRRRGVPHWLEGWAEENPDKAFVRSFYQPKGGAMGRWIQDRARESGGTFSSQGANRLASLIGEDTRLADQEIQKLLAYVNYQRPVEQEDVETLTAAVTQGDMFGMVDALAEQDGKKAIALLHNLLELQDAMSIFGMVVRQFRLLLLARDVLDRGGGPPELIQEYQVKPRLHPFVAEKSCRQARHFQVEVLETVYRRLLSLDEAIKTGRIEPGLALETFVADFTGQKRRVSFR